MTAARARACVAALALVVGAGAPARAQGPEADEQLPRRVVLDAGACPEVPASALRRIMAIEIGDLLVGARESVAGDTDRVAIACAGAVAVVRADGPGRLHARERTLPLDDFPGDAAPRALALAAIEILAALSPDVRARVEARQRPGAPARPPPVAVVVAAPAPRPSPSPPPLSRPSVLLVGAAVRAFVAAPGAATWGGSLGFRRALGARLELGVDGDLGLGTSSGPLGSVTSMLASAGAFVGARAGGPRLEAGVALGGRIGVVRFEGSAADPAAFVGARSARPWGGPCVVTRGRGSLGRVGLELGAELGYALGRAAGTAGDATVVAVGGPWLAFTAALGLEL